MACHQSKGQRKILPLGIIGGSKLFHFNPNHPESPPHPTLLTHASVKKVGVSSILKNSEK